MPALMTAVLPAMTYPGLLMTESLFLAAADVRALDDRTGDHESQPDTSSCRACRRGLATTVRLQGFVFFPTLLVALALVVICARESARRSAALFRSCWSRSSGRLALPLRRGSGRSPLRAYDTAAQDGYTLPASLAWIGWHLVDVAVFACVFPLFALAMLLVEIIRRRETDPEVVALVSITVAYLATSVALVGAFASEHVGQLAERDLISLAPPLFVAFSVWLARGCLDLSRFRSHWAWLWRLWRRFFPCVPSSPGRRRPTP